MPLPRNGGRAERRRRGGPGGRIQGLPEPYGFTTDRATYPTDRDAFLNSCIFEPCYQLTNGFRHLKMVETQHHSRSNRVSLFPLEYT